MTGEPYPMTDGRALSVSGELIGQNAQSLEQNFRRRQIIVSAFRRKVLPRHHGFLKPLQRI